MAARPIAILSGMGVPARLWRGIYFRRLAQHGLEPVLVDYASDWFAPGATPSVQQLAEACAARMQDLLARRPLLLGFSLGALIAQEIAKAAPGRLSGLVLVSPFAEQLAVQRISMEVEAAIRAGGGGRDWLALLDVLQLSGRAELFDDAVFAARYRARSRAGADPWDDALFHAVRAYDHQLAGLRAIRCPALVLSFADDLVVPPPCARRVAEAIPGAAFAEIAGAGHIGVLTHPQQVLAPLLDFVRATQPEPPAGLALTCGTPPRPFRSASSPPPAPAAA